PRAGEGHGQRAWSVRASGMPDGTSDAIDVLLATPAARRRTSNRNDRALCARQPTTRLRQVVSGGTRSRLRQVSAVSRLQSLTTEHQTPRQTQVAAAREDAAGDPDATE